MRKLTLILTLSIGVFLLNSCKDRNSISQRMGNSASLNDETLAHVPADANTVTTVNIQSIMDKMDFEAVKKMEFFADAKKEMQEDRPELVYLMEDPANSGIDLSKSMYMFTDMSDKENLFMGSMMTIKDAAKFAEMVEKSSEDNSLEIEKKSDYSYVRTGNNAAIIFNDKMAIVGSGMNDASLEAKLVDLLTNKPSKSITSNKKFRENFKGNHDFYSFQSFDVANEFLDGQSEDVMEALGLTKEDLKGNNMTMYGDFKDGQIEAISEMHLNKKVKEIFGALVKSKVRTDFSKYIPSENLMGAATMALNLEGINTLINEQLFIAQGADLQMNRMLGMSRDDLMKAFDGDAFTAAYGNADADEPSMLAGLKINDEKLVNEIMAKLKKKGIIKEISKNLYSVQFLGDTGYRISMKSDVMLVGTKDAMDNIGDGNFKPISKSRLKDLSGSFGMFADMSMVQKLYPDISMDKLDDFTVSGSLDGGKSTLNFKEKNQNSLKLLMELFNEMYKKDGKNNSNKNYDGLEM